ncbi:tryptophan--tRNA ligase [Nanchangia anserum]|uniref:Tryptophan--tRNA ligase n=1 Tax=Nanchangia anserum TaxID=2692125 RepID=A0A8I0GCT9_9ACTO|nr:tryptophan--tRNA ligase [Nanchangia anserum]MBD3689911.1 tryptophan--tRNA ligase [Nanchangia anserum]QOX82272.1 tryptophan--tRNA ligase [Nanchangia anserum]
MHDAEETLSDSLTDASLRRCKERSAEIEAEISDNPARFRVLTGDRPTGNLHLGHYFGTLKNRVDLQARGVDTWLVIADYQVITDRDGTGPVKERVYSLLADYLACGIDPTTATIFTHSAVPSLNQLMLPFLSLVTESELHRNPTVKAELEASDRAMSGLLLTYPVHQAADILFCRANLVPVGQDQLPHLEQTRLIADRFDKRYRRKSALTRRVFPRPEALLSQASHVLGLDGTKMSKSRGNAIELAMSADETAKLIRKAKTDSDRVITFDPVARPEVSNLLTLASLAGAGDPREIAASIGDQGAGALKRVVTDALNAMLEPIRVKRAALLDDRTYLREVLTAGNERANAEGEETLALVREAMSMVY